MESIPRKRFAKWLMYAKIGIHLQDFVNDDITSARERKDVKHLVSTESVETKNKKIFF